MPVVANMTWLLECFWKKRRDTSGHGDFDGNMSGAKAVNLDDQFGASCRIISQP